MSANVFERISLAAEELYNQPHYTLPILPAVAHIVPPAPRKKNGRKRRASSSRENITTYFKGTGWEDSNELLRFLPGNLEIIKIILCDYLGHVNYTDKGGLKKSAELYDNFFLQLRISENFRSHKKRYNTMQSNVHNTFKFNKTTTRAWIQKTALSQNSSYLDIHQADEVHIEGMGISDNMVLLAPSIQGIIMGSHDEDVKDNNEKGDTLPEFMLKFCNVETLKVSMLQNKMISLNHMQESAWSLTRIEIFKCPNLESLPFWYCLNLRILKCRECRIQKINRDIHRLTKLEVLDLYDNRIRDISVLKGMKALAVLNVGTNPLAWNVDESTDKLIESLPALTYLDVSSQHQNPLAEPIRKMYHPMLTYADVSHRLDINSCNLIKAFPKLQTLTMSGEDNMHLLHPPIEYHHNEHDLMELNYPNASYLPSCLHFPTLQCLRLQNFMHWNLGPVHQFEYLQHLDISHSQNIKNLDKEVVNLRYLVHLNISYTSIRFPVEVFARLQELLAVTANWNSIPSSVFEHRFLRKLDISGNIHMNYTTALVNMQKKLRNCEVIFNKPIHVY